MDEERDTRVATEKRVPDEGVSPVLSREERVMLDTLDVEAYRDYRYSGRDSAGDSEFSFKTLTQTLMARSRLITLVLLVFFLLGAAASLGYFFFLRSHTGVASSLIAFGFPEAQEGLNPHGLPLNVNAVRSPYVISSALDITGLRDRGITVSDVRANMRIGAVTPHDTLDEILLIRDSAARLPERLIYLEDVPNYPIEYVIYLYRGSALEYLSDYEMADLLNAIIRSYSEYFIEVYHPFRMMDSILTHFYPDDHDYFEIVRVFNGAVNEMLRYAFYMRHRAPNFRSPTTQMTFGDIWVGLDLLRSVEMTRLGALVHANNMSRNRQQAASILEYNIIRMEMELFVARSNVADILHLVEIYELERWFLTHQIVDMFEHIRSSELYDSLVRDTQRLMMRANELEADISFYNRRLASMSGTQQPVDPRDIAAVNASIPQITASLLAWEEIIIQTMSDFMAIEMFRDGVQVQTPASFRPSLQSHLTRVILITGAFLVAGLFVGVLVALYQGEAKDRRKIA